MSFVDNFYCLWLLLFSNPFKLCVVQMAVFAILSGEVFFPQFVLK